MPDANAMLHVALLREETEAGFVRYHIKHLHRGQHLPVGSILLPRGADTAAARRCAWLLADAISRALDGAPETPPFLRLLP